MSGVRYFADGDRVARVHTTASVGDPEFRSARTDVWQHRSKQWKESPGFAERILLSGDWEPISPP